MRRLSTTLLAGLLALPLAAPISEARQEQEPASERSSNPPAFTEDVRPLLKAYCTTCHNPTRRKGGLDLEAIDDEAAALGRVDLWERVGERLSAGEMPPVKSKPPTEQERTLLLAWVEHVARSQPRCDELTPEQRARSLAGYTGTRRLNRAEYNNTVRDLFGVDLHPGDLLPSEGGGGEGFDNTGSTLFITPVLIETYLEAAELVLGAILPAPGRDTARDEFDALALAAARRRLLGEGPGPSRPPRESALAVLESFLPRAFRRPVTVEELGRYLDLFDRAERRGLSYDQAIRAALKAVLIAPSFLFLVETPPEASGVYRLDPYQVAAHLSYFLWSSMPDDELTRLAREGRLHDPGVLRAQVRRMTRDPRSRGLADGFAAQWLGIRDLGTTVRPDAKLFPEFTSELAAAMREETVLCFDAIIREDRSVLELLDARHTFVNERLAGHYKIEGVEGPRMRRVELVDPRRGGVLGQAAILTATSYPHRTSPVLRGRWILEELLGAEVPPPPPDVPVLNERRKDAKDLTLRQRLEQHRAKPECASCHSRMDPLGFGLEEFDPLGRWRAEQGDKPIDSTGKLPTGEEFRGPAELKAILLGKRRPEFLRNLSRKLLGYALGREVNRVDMCVVDECVEALEWGDYRSSLLLETIVTSYPFLHRYHEEARD